MPDSRVVPGFEQLPLAKQARVHVLSLLQQAVERRPEWFDRLRSRMPRSLDSALRRWVGPVRIPRQSRASVPLDTTIDAVAPAGRGTPEASLVVPMHDAWQHTLLCLRSILAFTDGPDYELIVVDDASSKATRLELLAFARDFAQITLLHNDENQGFARSVNRGVSVARGRVVVIMNNDVVVTPGWLHGLIDVLESEPDIALVSPLTNDSGDAATISADYATLDELVRFARTLPARSPIRVSKAALFCAALRRDLLSELGGLDAGYGRGMFEDDDLCMALEQSGRRIVLAPHVFVHHTAGASFRKLPSWEYLARFEVNRARFEHKWGTRWRPPLPY